MIQRITGWDLTLAEEDLCPHCHDPSAHLVIADPESWQEKRESLAEELGEKSVAQLKSDCATLHLSTVGNKDVLVDRLVSQAVALDDPLKRHEQYFDHMTRGSSDGVLPKSYMTYRANFNSVDMFNRSLYSLKFPKTQSEILHLFVGQIHIALTNALAIRNYIGDSTSLMGLRTVVGRELLDYM